MDAQKVANVYLEAMEENQYQIPQSDETGTEQGKGVDNGQYKKGLLENLQQPYPVSHHH